jgi:hypothetical protein
MSKSATQFEHLRKDRKEKRSLSIVKKSDKKIDKTQNKTLNDKYKEFKEVFMEKNTLKSMVFENGSALALIFKELQKLHYEVQQIKNQNNNEFNKN